MNTFRRIAILLIVVLLAGSVASLADDGPSGSSGNGNSNGNNKEKRQPASHDGAYDIRISGYFNGSGKASVSSQNVSIVADVKADGGSVTTLKAENLKVSGAYFNGTGTVGGKSVTIKGRLDAAKISRLTAMYKTDDNHRGRIVGSLPGDKPNEKWDDDDPAPPATQNRPHRHGGDDEQ